jgi:hypothetical protein
MIPNASARAPLRPKCPLFSSSLVKCSSICFQHNLPIDNIKVLNLWRFRSTTEARICLFDLERNLSNNGLPSIFSRSGTFAPPKHVQRIIRATKRSVEINDDYGIAILVVTVVTLAFLPLSSVTNFLGMSTADITNQTSTQSLFYIVALPVATVVVVGFFVGYKYEFTSEWTEVY